LWLIGWILAVTHLAVQVAGTHTSGAGLALANACMTLSALMFLGSMSPLGFKRAPRFLYAYAFAVPLCIYAVITAFRPNADGALRILLVLCTVASIIATTLWGLRKRLLPQWFTAILPVIVGIPCIWLTWQQEYLFVLYLAQSSSNFMTALLFAASYRRLSPGVIFTSAGFFLWSTPVVLDVVFAGNHSAQIFIGRGINLVKVMTAVGMVLLVLEDEVAQNRAAKERDHRARLELERYSAIDLSMLSDLHTAAAYRNVCEVITQVSRFHQAAIFLNSMENNLHMAAHSGMGNALVHALERLGKSFTPERNAAFSQSGGIAIEIGNTLQLDLRQLFEPNDALEQMGYTKVHAIPMRTRAGASNGALVLSGLKRPDEPLLADDLLPLELLVSRLTAMRENHLLMQRIARSEKLAGLGQLAAGVAHELNNPLTVVLGYSELLEETLEDQAGRSSVSLIRCEAQRMHQIIESMLRFWRSSPIEHTTISISEILEDIYRLRRPEFDRRRIDLQISMPDDLPSFSANRDQLQQVLLQVLNNALETFENYQAIGQSVVRIEAIHFEDNLKVLISDNGPGFADPNRVFDPFFTTKQPRLGTGMGLSVCYAIVRDHGGDMTAHNLQPQGALVIVELPLTRPPAIGAGQRSVI
jgi:two-component system, NtrC family, sensor kinase